jgi:hypothetical protein
MEPADTPVRYAISPVRYVVYVKVMSVTLRERLVSARMVNEEVQEIRESLGWFVHFDGSREALFFGHERPDFYQGNTVRITFERIFDAKS